MAFKGRDGAEPQDQHDDDLALLGAIKEAESQTAVIKIAEMIAAYFEALAKAAKKQPKRPSSYGRRRGRRR